MSADTDSESDSADSPKRHRGRIPQSAWPQILQRHRAGATLSAIAREFDCTPSAISYIVRKAEAAGVEPPASVIAPPPAPRPAAPPAPPPAVPQPSGITTLSLPDRSGTPKNPPPAAAAPSPAPASVTVATVAGETGKPAAEAPPVTGTGRPAQPPPVDAIEARLRETARACLVAYRGWRQGPAETGLQTLNDAVHDLRKVLARIEIDMSASRREEQALRPIPVPQHRAARQR